MGQSLPLTARGRQLHTARDARSVPLQPLRWPDLLWHSPLLSRVPLLARPDATASGHSKNGAGCGRPGGQSTSEPESLACGDWSPAGWLPASDQPGHRARKIVLPAVESDLPTAILPGRSARSAFTSTISPTAPGRPAGVVAALPRAHQLTH